MNPPGWMKDTWELLVWPAVQRAASHIWKHPLPWLVAIVVGLTTFVAWETYRRNASHQLVVLLGPPGSSGRRMGQLIADDVDNQSIGLGARFTALTHPTQGYEEMRDILSADKKGLTVGFAIDDGGADRNLRVLMPLDWDYLHVLVRTKFLEEHFGQRQQWPSELGEVAGKIGKGKVFGGPRESGTRRIATAVLNKYFPDSGEVKVEDLVAHHVDDWKEAGAALSEGTIDLAFYTGPIESDTVQLIADEGTAVLMGLDDIADAVAREPRHAVTKAVIPRNVYRASPLGTEAEPQCNSTGLARLLESWFPRKKPLRFCGQQLTTLAVRRLVVGTAAMSEHDAYFLSKTIANSLANCVPSDSWRPSSPLVPSPPPAMDVRMSIHPGATLASSGQPFARWFVPSSWNSTFFKSAFYGALALAVTQIVAFIGDWLKLRRTAADQPRMEPAEEPSAPDRRPVESFRLRLNTLLVKVSKLPEPPTRSDFDRCVKDARELRREVDGAKKAATLTEKDAEILLAGLRELWVDLNFRQPVRPARPRKPA